MTRLCDFPTRDAYEVTGVGRYQSAFAVSDLAERAVAAVGVELAKFLHATNLAPSRPEVTVDRNQASHWFKYSFRPIGWELPALWDPIAGDYACADGWIRLHTNLPHHRAAALRVLGCAPSREAVEATVARWAGDRLETQVVTEGGAAAFMRARADWLAHPQGQAVAQEPLIRWNDQRRATLRARPHASCARPLAGLRVLDLTRVLAGPVCTRTLAGFGADVLRIDPPGWDEPGVLQDIALGKHMATLDLKSAAGLHELQQLMSDADVVIHGYRPGALAALGLGEDIRDQLAPERIEIALNAYGWTGPWSARRGFDSLVQMSSGLAHAGQLWASSERPTPLPVQALDHACGYMMAAACLSALSTAAAGGCGASAVLSLARVSEALWALPLPECSSSDPGLAAPRFDAEEASSWGIGQRLSAPLGLSGTQMGWDLPAQRCGSAEARWPVA